MNKAILVTGCSSGIGRSIADTLLNTKYIIYATARKPESVENLKRKGAVTLALDVTDKKSIENVVSRIKKDGVQLFGLINNAGFGQMGPIEEVTEEQARNQLNTNVIGLASITRALLPLMRIHGEGRIINIGSIAGKVSLPLSGWYSASKFAVEALSDALRLEVGQFGIRVVVIEPGPIRSNFGEVAYSSTDHIDSNSAYKPMLESMTKWSKSTFNDRVAGQPVDVANVVLKVLEKRNPRPRYRITQIARFLYLVRAITCDRMLDIILRKQMGIKRVL